MTKPIAEADVFRIVDEIFKQNPNGAWVSLRWNPKEGTAGDWIKGPDNVTPKE